MRIARHLLVTSTLLCTIAAVPETRSFDQAPYLQPARLVDVGHAQRINLYCSGSGKASVVLVNGFGEPAFTWRYMQPEIARFARVCSYDEPATGFSDPAPPPRTSAVAARDLRMLLNAGGVRPPYVLVAHSLGGFTARLFADRYRSEVAAMVLLDPTVEGFANAIYAIDPKLRKLDAQELASERKCISSPVSCAPPRDPHLSDELNNVLRKPFLLSSTWRDRVSEEGNIGADEREVRAAQRFYGSMPLIVLSRPISAATGGPSSPISTKRAREMDEARLRLQRKLTAESTRGSFSIVPRTGHFIMEDRPDAVVAVVRRVMSEHR